MVIYDITDKKSFEIVNKWIDSIFNLKDYKKFPDILIGNKIDLKDERIISFDEGKKKAIQHNIDFYETSAKENINVELVFQSLIDKIVEINKKEFLTQIDSINFELKNDKVEKKGKCCGNENKGKK